MQVVIDIDDEVYERLKNSEVLVSGLRSGKHFLSKVCMAVANGDIIPKGHGDLIDSSNLLFINDYDGENERIYVPYYEIENAKPIIKADKEWIKKWKKID